MLAYILAIAVGLASLSLYLSAFFLPELHRKDDFLWSGVGLFYALVLWVCAGRMTGGVLLGQSAAVTLVLCFGWQTLRLRRVIAHPQEKTDFSGFSLLTWIQNRFQKKSPAVTPPVTETPVAEAPEEEEKPNLEETSAVIEEMAIAESETISEETPIISEVETEETTSEEIPVTSEVETEETTSEETPLTSEVETEETTSEETPIISEVETEDSETREETSSTVTATPETKKQGFSWKSIFGFGKSQSQPSTEPPKNLIEDTELDEDEWEEDEDKKDASEMEEVTSTLVEETDFIESETLSESSEEPLIESETLSESSEEPLIEPETLSESSQEPLIEPETFTQSSEEPLIESETFTQSSEEPLIESEVNSEESTDKASSETPETLQEYMAEVEPFIADNDAETLIENYQPKIEKSSPQTPEKSDKNVNDN